jgi:hypothetical protein
MMRMIFLTLLVVTVILGCAGHPAYESRKKMREGYPPEILDHYAAKTIRPGEIWRIYLRIRDSDCDMTYVVADLWQAGVGPYAASFTPIKGAGCREVHGYLALNTPVDPGLIQDRLEIKVLVRDRRGNRSQAIIVTLDFDTRSAGETPERWLQAASYRLGTIQIDLRSSQSF